MPDRAARVVIVAPTEYNPGLSVAPLPHQIEEIVEALRAFYEPQPLIGRVTERQMANELRETADGFWFIGHAQSGAGGGILLSDGLLSAVALGRYLGRSGVSWSYLNTCDSGSFVSELQSAHPHDVFANIVREINDVDAARNGVLMAQNIADSGSIERAYRWVISGGPSVLRLFPSPDGESVSRESRDVIRATTEDRVRRLEQIMNGDPNLGILGLVAQFKQIDTRLRVIQWSLIAAAVVVLMTLIVEFSRPEPRTIVVLATPTATWPAYPGMEPGVRQ